MKERRYQMRHQLSAENQEELKRITEYCDPVMSNLFAKWFDLVLDKYPDAILWDRHNTSFSFFRNPEEAKDEDNLREFFPSDDLKGVNDKNIYGWED